jgi:phytoene dehydrogenase-like protein
LPEKKQSKLVDKIIGILEEMTGEKIADRIVSQYVFGPGDFADRFNAWQCNAFGGESHLLRQSIIFRTANKSKKLKNLYYVGAGTLPGIGLPMCLISAQLTYKRIVGNRQPGPLAKEDI